MGLGGHVCTQGLERGGIDKSMSKLSEPPRVLS